MHVMVTKPMVKTLAEHRALAAAAREHKVLVALEVRQLSTLHQLPRTLVATVRWLTSRP